MNKNWKKLLICLLCSVFVVTLVTACGGGGGEQEPADTGSEETSGEPGVFDWKAHEGTTLSVMFNEHNYSKAVIQKLADFEELTGITVEYSSTPEENYFDKLNTSLNSRSGTPDVFMTGAYQVWEYAPAGYCEPLDDYINDAAKTSPEYDFSDFYEGVVGALRWDLVPGHAVGAGSQWALPMGWEINDLAYNKRVFDEKGLTVPVTTEELLETSKAQMGFNGTSSYGIALRGTRNWATIHPGYMSLFSTWGAQDFAIEDGKLVCKLDSPEAIAMTDYWVKLIKEGGSPQWSTYTWYQAGADLGAGQAAMLFDATCNGYFQNVPDASAEAGNIVWSTIPLPPGKTEADMKANIWIWSLAMNADSKNKDAAWYFLQYFTGPEYMLFAGTDGNSPDTPRRSVGDSAEYKAVVGQAEGYLESIEKLLPNATIQFTPQPAFFECTTMWAATLQDLVTSNKYSSTEAAMKELKVNLDKVVAEFPVE
jgi:multiple sugar transport system substrate-binding protein